MNKKLRKVTTYLLMGIVLSGIIFTGTSQTVQADTTETPSYQSVEQEKTTSTKKEKNSNEKKLKLAEDYYKTKSKSKSGAIALRDYGETNTVSFKPVAQQKGYYCGPATAYSVTNGAASQDTFANELGTNKSNQTPFPGTWTATLNKYRPGNNYTVARASSYSDWRDKLKRCIIFTIDNGYPIAADCHITTDSDTWLSSGYDYAQSTYHYVTVGGYDDNEDTVPAEVLIGDSNTHAGISRRYWTTLDKLTAATEDFGIIW